MKNNFIIAIALIQTICLGSLTTSCSYSYYPRLIGIPLIKEKGDTRVEGGITFMPATVQASVSHGVTEKIAVQVAGTANAIPASVFDTDGQFYGHGAIGFYKKIKDHYITELYGGFAYGQVGSTATFFKGTTESGNYQMYFTQFNFGNIEKKPSNLELGFGLKLGYMHSDMRIVSELYDKEYNINGIFVEPTLLMRRGGPKWKFHVALGACWLFQLTNTPGIAWWPVNFGIGVSYLFGKNKNNVN